MSVTPVVAIVGRPNVGKSTLFNRLVGRKQSIVHDQPGVTRDRIVGDASLGEGRAFQVIDTGGLVPGDDPLGLSLQVDIAIDESDLLLFLVDGKQGITSADERIWASLRPRNKRTFLVVNKGDTRAAVANFAEFYALGIETQVLVSAEHGTGIADLREAMASAPAEATRPEAGNAPAIAIVGRPNVGKSSLLNRISGSQRSIVSPTAGTTRDPVDSLVEHDGKSYLLIDTAGIRRRSKTSGEPEELAVLLARRQAERAEICILMVDATDGIGASDLTIAGMLWECGKAAVVAVNKWDLLDEALREKLDFSYPRLAEILANPERVNISASSGRSVEKLFPAIDRTLEGYRRTLGTGEVNRLFEDAIVRHRPPSEKGKAWKLFYATQVSSGPPTFMLFANRTLSRQHSYRRYLENVLRDNLVLPGVPIRLVIRQR